MANQETSSTLVAVRSSSSAGLTPGSLEPATPTSHAAFSDDTPSKMPANTPTTYPNTPFYATSEKDRIGEVDTLEYQCISMMPTYSRCSLEEVRLADYEKGNLASQRGSGAGQHANFGSGGSTFSLQPSTAPVETERSDPLDGANSSGTTPGQAASSGLTSEKPQPLNTTNANHPLAVRRLKYQDDSTVKVFVGSTKVPFNIHQNLVCKVSPVFLGACNSLFKEALSGEIYLSEADPEAFDIFMEWVYTGLIEFPGHPPNEQSIGDHDAWWSLVAKMYVLAHYLQSTSFGNKVIDFIVCTIMRKQVLQSPQCGVIDLVYSSTTGDCGLRKLFVALTVWRTGPERWEEVMGWKTYLEGLPAEYSHDLVVRLQRRHHQLDQDPFVSEKKCQIFRDAELEQQATKGWNDATRACSQEPE